MNEIERLILIIVVIGMVGMQGWTLYYTTQTRSDLFVRTMSYNSAVDSFEACLKKHRGWR
jgi:hypothetical protein